MAFFYSAFYDYFTALLRPTLYLFFRDISRKLRNLRFNFRHILNGFICLIFLVEFSFLTIQFVFVYLFGCLYSSYLFGCGHSSIHPHTYWFSSLSQFSELFSYSYLSVIYSWFIQWFIRRSINGPPLCHKKSKDSPPPHPPPTIQPLVTKNDLTVYTNKWEEGKEGIGKIRGKWEGGDTPTVKGRSWL